MSTDLHTRSVASRRDFLRSAGGGLGMLALSALLDEQGLLELLGRNN